MAKGLFSAEQRTLDDALEVTAQSLTTYGETHHHWCLAFSGGKDSTATFCAVDYLIGKHRVPYPQTRTLLYADTRLELPNLQAAAMGILASARERGWQTRTVLPRMEKRFYVMILGRGIPPSHSGFRWCTGALKVDPMASAMRSIREQTGSKLLLITGMRIGESANRDRRIALSCGKNGGECGQGWYEETTPAEVADVLSPILHWRTCHVWDWLDVGGRARHGHDCSQVCEVYDHGAEDSPLEVLSRTGCLVCPVASSDHALERTIRKPEWAYLKPLKRLREIYDSLSRPCVRLQKVGERRADGSLSSNPMRLGPIIPEARAAGLTHVLEIQAEVNALAHKQGRPLLSLIDAEEEAMIRHLIHTEAWPDGWSSDDLTAVEVTHEVARDGTIQHYLWAASERASS